jgi:hypothetical protein
MGSFKRYLVEMPYFTHGQIRCPCALHTSNILIDGSKSEYSYDMVAERFKDPDYRKRMQSDIHYGRPHPFWCRNDLSVFMYSDKTKEAYAPKTPEDVLYCEEYVKTVQENYHNPDQSQRRNVEIPAEQIDGMWVLTADKESKHQ